MALYDRDYTRPVSRTASLAVSSFASRVYGWMTLGLALTAIVAYLVVRTGAYVSLMNFWWLMALGTLGIALAINGLLQRASFGVLATLFLAYATIEGLFFGTVLPAYAYAAGGQAIWMAFGTGALVFGTAMCYGLMTKSDLTGIGKILMIALIGLVAVTLLYAILSFFFAMPWMNLLISYIGLIIFVGLTAYDAQQIRSMGQQVDPSSVMSYKLSLMMALRMYINVIMIFWYLLQIFANNRN